MTDSTAGEAIAEAQDTTVTITRLVSSPIKVVWSQLVSKAGAEALLGEGAVLGEKGDKWEAKDGSYGMVRSYHPMEQLRFTWHADADAPKTMVDLHVVPAGASTNIEIRHEHVPATTDTESLVKHWESALDRLWKMNA